MPRPEAVRLGLQHLSHRTPERLSGLSGDSLLLACADGRWTRRHSGHRSITEEVREAIFAVRAECGERARLSLAARHRLMHQYIRERFPTLPTEKIPSRWTFAAVWEEWFGPGGARPRYGRTAEAAAEAGVSGRMVVHRPGQVLVLDSTPMPVKLRETVLGEAVTATLTLALDLYTHALPAFRLTLQSDTSVDVAMLLRDVMLPLPMRDGWGKDMEWPYAGVPADVIAEFTGHRVAALPYFAPETVTTDHGGPYKNHDLVEAEREIGCRILPARVLRQTDKFAVERQFLSVQTMLFEYLLGFTGGDVADRGADPERDASLTLTQAGHPSGVVTAEHDPLHDEGDAYARRLAQAGVTVRHRREPGLEHGFIQGMGLTDPTAAAAHDRIFADLRDLIPRRHAGTPETSRCGLTPVSPGAAPRTTSLLRGSVGQRGRSACVAGRRGSWWR